MHFDLVIRNARLTTSAVSEVGDIAVSDGRIAAIGNVDGTGAVEVDAKGLALIAGVIDTQVHFREPGLTHKEDLESGTRAAILGGVTSIFEMPNTNPTTTDQAALQEKLRMAEGRTWCDYSFFVGASGDNIDQLAELEMEPGTPGIKVFMGSSTGPLLVDGDDTLRRVLQSGKRRVPVHAEDEARNRERKALLSEHPDPREHPFLRDAESARLATQRILALSEETARPVHVLHVSTADELPLLKEAKAKGIGTTCEVTPQHLWFSAPDCYARLGSRAQMNPPIRSLEHRDALRKAVAEGLFDVFGSDHAPHTLEEKSQPYPASPSGMPGVQTILSALLTMRHQGLFDLQTLVKMASETPAEIYGVKNKGRLEVGYDADFVLIDLDATYLFDRSMVASKCGWSPFEGEQFVGKVEQVFLRGHRQVQDSVLVGTQCGAKAEFNWK
ncbi:MAG TPA: dihydroorotase [Fimbriimonadaceae bacterium]|nr:dihydroorotase [Fimbriimonadaceae bacterium]